MAKAETETLDFFEKVGYVFSLWAKSWDAFKLNLWTFIILYLLPLGVIMITSTFYILPALKAGDGLDSISVIGFIIAISITLIAMLFTLLLYPAQIVTQLSSVNGKEISLGDALSQGLKHLLQFIVFAIVGGAIIVGPLFVSLLLVIVIIGILLLPFAFVWALVATFFLYLVPYLIVAEKLPAIDAMKKSFEITKSKWQWVLAMLIVSIVISILSSIPIFGQVIGLVLGIVYLCMPAIVYTQIIVTKEKKSAKQAK